jgi:hypothetical protein
MKKSTLILLLVAVALGGFVYFYEIKGAKKREEAKESAKQIFPFKQEEIAALSLTRAGETMSFEKRSDGWVMTQPISAKADQSALDNIATNLSTATVERKFPASADNLKTYGLNNPKINLTVKLKNGQQHQLRLGDDDFAKTAVYALVDNNNSEVALAPTYLLTSVDKSRFDLRDKSVLDVPQAEINALELKTPEGQFSLVKQGEKWQLKQPGQWPADTSEVDSILSSLTSARITAVVADEAQDLKPYGLDNPVITARLRTSKGNEQVLMLGNKEGEQYYGKVSTRPVVFKVNADVYNKLDPTLFSLRNKRVAIFDREQLTRIRYKDDHQTIVCEKNAQGKWALTEPADKKGKPVRQYVFLNPLEFTDAKEIHDTPSKDITAKLADPAVTVELTQKNGQTITVSISKKVDNAVYARNNLSPTVMKFEGRLLDEVSVKKVEDIVQ